MNIVGFVMIGVERKRRRDGWLGVGPLKDSDTAMRPGAVCVG